MHSSHWKTPSVPSQSRQQFHRDVRARRRDTSRASPIAWALRGRVWLRPERKAKVISGPNCVDGAVAIADVNTNCLPDMTLENDAVLLLPSVPWAICITAESKKNADFSAVSVTSASAFGITTPSDSPLFRVFYKVSVTAMTVTKRQKEHRKISASDLSAERDLPFPNVTFPNMRPGGLFLNPENSQICLPAFVLFGPCYCQQLPTDSTSKWSAEYTLLESVTKSVSYMRM